MTDIELVTLEDGKICIIIAEEIIDNNKYVYLVNTANRKDYIIRKEKNNELIGLDNEEEFNKVTLALLQKIKSGDQNV
jgi:hypothetical protein